MTTAASTATAPVADSRALGLAHYAARGVLEHVLAGMASRRSVPQHGTFQQQVALGAAVTAETPQTPDDLVARVRGSLKADPAGIRTTVDELLVKQLLAADGAHLRPTDAGRELLAAVGAERAPISARIWGGIPAEDLAATGRVLGLVAGRANAELAALTS